MRFKSEQNMILPGDEQNPGKSSTRRRQVCKRPEISLPRYRNYSCHYSSSNHILCYGHTIRADGCPSKCATCLLSL